MIPRWAHITGVLGIAAAHTWLFLELFGRALGASLAGRGISTTLEIAMGTLGAPLMYLFSPVHNVLKPLVSWWHLQEFLLTALAILNGLLWGMALMWVLQVWTRRRRHAA